jgi:hypothetical protein
MNGNIKKSEEMDAETRAHQDRTAGIRFKQSLIQGIGGPMVFGLVFAASAALFQLAFSAKLAALTGGGAAQGVAAVAATAATVWPVVAIAAMVLVGVGCIYYASKLNSELTRLEHNYSARQIAKGINGKSPVLEMQPSPVPFASQGQMVSTPDKPQAVQTSQPLPQMQVTSVEHQDKVLSFDAHRAAGA